MLNETLVQIVITKLGCDRNTNTFKLENIYKSFLKKLLSYVERVDTKEIVLCKENQVVDIAKMIVLNCNFSVHIHSSFLHLITKPSFPKNCYPRYMRYYNFKKAILLIRRMIYLGELDDVTHLPVIIPYISSKVNEKLHKLIVSNMWEIMNDGWGHSWCTHMVLCCKYIKSKPFKINLLNLLENYSLCSTKAWRQRYK